MVPDAARRHKGRGGARLGWAILALGIILGGAPRGLAVEDPHGVGYDGHDWRAMSEQARLAYIAGFLAGAVTQQALDRHRANPRLSVDASVAEILRTHAGTFPFGVAVYKNDLDDYYFYRTNLSVRIYRALLNENAGMLRVPPPK